MPQISLFFLSFIKKKADDRKHIFPELQRIIR